MDLVWLVRTSMGAVEAYQQHEHAATRSNRVGSVTKLEDELPIFGVRHRKAHQLSSVHGNTDDGERDCTRQTARRR